MLASEWEGIDTYLSHLKKALVHEVFQVDWCDFQEWVRQSTLDVIRVRPNDVDALCRWSKSGLFGATASLMFAGMGTSYMDRWEKIDTRVLSDSGYLARIRDFLPSDIQIYGIRDNPMKDYG